MKLQELLPGSKSSPSPRSRGGRGEQDASEFADALTEARRKPEPKPAKAEAPAVKKPATARKSNPASDDAAPTDDAITTDPQGADDVQSKPAADETEPVATDEEDATDTDDSEESPESDVIEASIEGLTPSLIPTMGPAAPIAADAVATEAQAEAATNAPRAARPMPKDGHPVAIAKPEEGDSDAQSAELAGSAEDIAATVLEGFEGLDQQSPGDADTDQNSASTAKAPVAPSSPSASSVEGDAVPKPDTKPKETPDQQLPAVGNEVSMTAEGNSAADDTDSAMVSIAGGDSATATSAAHVQPETAKTQATPAAPAAPTPVGPQAHFVEANHPKIVTSVQTQALTNGGTMQIRLDPPELGALQVLVHMQDGVMTASFQTSNDDATRLLSHSLSQLKQVLESQGVSVEKLQVQQAPKDQQASNSGEDHQQQRDQQGDAHRQEQQRKEMLRRMWRRLSNGSDPLDLVA